MVEIPGGKFVMGSPPQEQERYSNESPQHTVTVQPFFMGKFTITQEQYRAAIGNNPSYFKGATKPVEAVSWNQAIAFCDILSKRTGKTYLLPSEVEWEYACRAGTTTPFHFGSTLTTALAKYNADFTYGAGSKGEYRQQTIDVGTFLPNAFYLYDMYGNGVKIAGMKITMEHLVMVLLG